MSHEIRLLSKLGQTRVESCSCGVIHLTVGAVSLRLSAQQATHLAHAIASAAPNFAQADSVTAAQAAKAERGDDQDPPEGKNQIH